MTVQTNPQRSPWDVLLDKIAFGILNWRSTLKGVLGIYIAVSGAYTAAQWAGMGGHNAQWFFSFGLGAKAIISWLSADAPGSLSATEVTVSSVTVPTADSSGSSSEASPR